LILAVVFAMMVLMLPVLFGVIVFFAASVALFMLLARFGLLPGVVFRTYRFTDERAEPPSEERTDATAHERVGGPLTESSWYQDTQDGEVIILPETALKKAEKNDE
jgi:hypothetical protein